MYSIVDACRGMSSDDEFADDVWIQKFDEVPSSEKAALIFNLINRCPLETIDLIKEILIGEEEDEEDTEEDTEEDKGEVEAVEDSRGDDEEEEEEEVLEVVMVEDSDGGNEDGGNGSDEDESEEGESESEEGEEDEGGDDENDGIIDLE
ncbi:10331_t:CDS:2, partial [Entrophospora sp. SA101]